MRNRTLRDNVLFGKAMMKTKYDQTIEACALDPDLKILPAGDMTEIGEKVLLMSKTCILAPLKIQMHHINSMNDVLKGYLSSIYKYVVFAFS